MRNLIKKSTAVLMALLMVAASAEASFAAAEAELFTETAEGFDIVMDTEDVTEVEDIEEVSESSGETDGSLTVLSESGNKAVAVYSGSSLTFYYDSKDHTAEGTVMDVPNIVSTGESIPWYWYNNDIKEIEFTESFKGYAPTSTGYWFYCLTELETIEGLGNINTKNVTDMEKMFKDCDSLAVLDLSGFNTAKVTNMKEMFYSCGELVTIYASPVGFITDGIESGKMLFGGNEKLVGGKGTVSTGYGYDKSHAHIDEGEQNPGFFTLKPASFVNEPEAQDLTYDGTEHELLSEGEADGGTVLYSLNGSDWDEAVPKEKDTGEYTVYYKIENDEHHGAGPKGSFKVTIKKKQATVTADNKEKKYSEEDPGLTATVTGTENGESLEYILTRTTGTDIGTYDITVTLTDD